MLKLLMQLNLKLMLIQALFRQTNSSKLFLRLISYIITPQLIDFITFKVFVSLCLLTIVQSIHIHSWDYPILSLISLKVQCSFILVIQNTLSTIPN